MVQGRDEAGVVALDVESGRHVGGGAEAHEVAIERRIALGDGGGEEARGSGGVAIGDLFAFIERGFGIENEAPVDAAEAKHGFGCRVGGIGDAGEGEKEMAGLMTEYGERGIGLLGAEGNQLAGIHRVVGQGGHVHDGAQAGGRTVIGAMVGGRHAIAGADGAYGAFICDGSGGGEDAEVVIDDEVVIGVFVSFVELLRDADDIDIHCIAEAFEDRAALIGGGVMLKGDEGGAAAIGAGGDADNGGGRRGALVGELNPAIDEEDRLKGHGGRGAELGDADPTEDHTAGIGRDADATGAGARGVEIIEEGRDARGAAGHASDGAAAAGRIAGGEGEIAIGIEEDLAVGGAEEGKGEGEGNLARIVVAEGDYGRALGCGCGIVGGGREGVAIGGGGGSGGGEEEGGAVEVELIELFDYASGIFNDGDVADVAIGGGGRGGGAGSGAADLAMEEERFGGGVLRGGTGCGVATGIRGGGRDEEDG